MRYAWIIDVDHLADEDIGTSVGLTGPRNAAPELIARLSNGEGHRFEMRDDDGESYYLGRVIYSDPKVTEGFEPLEDFGMPNAGATSILFGGKPL